MSGAFREVPHFMPGVVPRTSSDDEPAWWFIVRDQEVLLWDEGELPCIPGGLTADELGISLERPHFLGELDGRRCWAAALAAESPGLENARWDGLRGLFTYLPDDLLAVAARAIQVVAWDLNHRFCGRCGEHTDLVANERARCCSSCGLTAFPRIAPAVIVLIERDGAILLARGRRFATGMYGLIAGFVEPGESLEDAAHREIHEEVGLTVSDLQYSGSQPWPFPHSLMVGFTAKWAGGEIRVDPAEIEDARWFRPDALPLLPSEISIARRLIDDYLAQRSDR